MFLSLSLHSQNEVFGILGMPIEKEIVAAAFAVSAVTSSPPLVNSFRKFIAL
jgi:hypothetical protein